jgi:hypothetical protein
MIFQTVTLTVADLRGDLTDDGEVSKGDESKLSWGRLKRSNSTSSPASKVRYPLATMSLKCTNASRLGGRSGDEIAPQPFSGRKNFTVPLVMIVFSLIT